MNNWNKSAKPVSLTQQVEPYGCDLDKIKSQANKCGDDALFYIKIFSKY